jgi:hypothetical protein
MASHQRSKRAQCSNQTSLARGLSKREIAKRLKTCRTSVRRVLMQKEPRPESIAPTADS